MARVHYSYNTTTSQFKRVKFRLWKKILNTLFISFIVAGTSVLMVVLYRKYFEPPRELMLMNEIRAMEMNFDDLDKRLTSLNETITSLEKRDDNVYRTILGVEPIDKAVRQGGVGGAIRYADILNKRMHYAERIVTLFSRIQKIQRKVYIESISQDELIKLSDEKQKRYASIPAIQPLSNKQLTALASGFGMRKHPIYKKVRMHPGIDFAAPQGTPIYATADGIVVAARTGFFGYGTMVVIDHGFGYQTRYAHLKSFITKPGAKVKRGEAIAFVGNTGQSTGPHLHYEVLLKGIKINPIHYFFNDLTPAEYQKIIQLASIPNQSLGN